MAGLAGCLRCVRLRKSLPRDERLRHEAGGHWVRQADCAGQNFAGRAERRTVRRAGLEDKWGHGLYAGGLRTGGHWAAASGGAMDGAGRGRAAIGGAFAYPTIAGGGIFLKTMTHGSIACRFILLQALVYGAIAGGGSGGREGTGGEAAGFGAGGFAGLLALLAVDAVAEVGGELAAQGLEDELRVDGAVEVAETAVLEGLEVEHDLSQAVVAEAVGDTLGAVLELLLGELLGAAAHLAEVKELGDEPQHGPVAAVDGVELTQRGGGTKGALKHRPREVALTGGREGGEQLPERPVEMLNLLGPARTYGIGR